MRRKVDVTVLVPLILLAVILTFFAIRTNGTMVNARNLRTIFDQSMLTIIVALGTIFVVATGGADLSVGTTIGITTVFGSGKATSPRCPVYSLRSKGWSPP